MGRDSKLSSTTSESSPENNFKPCLYRFKMPDNLEEDDVHVSPPLWALFDHLIAAVWQLNSPGIKHEVPEVEQLQWVLHFLNSLTMECDQFRYVHCFRKSLNSTVLDKLRSTSQIFVKNVKINDTVPVVRESSKTNDAEVPPEEGETKKDEEKSTLIIPIILQDILSQQPAHLKLRTKKTCGESGSNGLGGKQPTLPCNLDKSGYTTCPLSCRKNDQSSCQHSDCEERLKSLTANKEELTKFLTSLKQNQSEILQKEQQHMDLLNSIIEKIN